MEELQSLIEADYEVRDSALIPHGFVSVAGPLVLPVRSDNDFHPCRLAQRSRRS